MFTPISKYLEKFKKMEAPEGAVKNATINIIYEKMGMDLDANSINFRDRVAYINTHPTLKSEIKINKQEILTLINKELGENSVLDIR